ncbi:MAG: hypothetical protein M3O70_28495, partial [Actinomycetota bacterium]|nr:hypothetical protein [Actinomycetota bacterium]
LLGVPRPGWVRFPHSVHVSERCDVVNLGRRPSRLRDGPAVERRPYQVGEGPELEEPFNALVAR